MTINRKPQGKVTKLKSKFFLMLGFNNPALKYNTRIKNDYRKKKCVNFFFCELALFK